MNVTTTPAAAMARLRDALAHEVRIYGEVLATLARQNGLLRRHDLDALHALADAWADLQAEADGLRQRRIEAQECAARAAGLPADARLGEIAALPRDGAAAVAAQRGALQTVLTAIERQNALNGRLARFCLDLVAGEAEAVSRGLRERAGTYDGKGAMATGAGGGVITRQA